MPAHPFVSIPTRGQRPVDRRTHPSHGMRCQAPRGRVARPKRRAAACHVRSRRPAAHAPPRRRAEWSSRRVRAVLRRSSARKSTKLSWTRRRTTGLGKRCHDGRRASRRASCRASRQAHVPVPRVEHGLFEERLRSCRYRPPFGGAPPQSPHGPRPTYSRDHRSSQTPTATGGRGATEATPRAPVAAGAVPQTTANVQADRKAQRQSLARSSPQRARRNPPSQRLCNGPRHRPRPCPRRSIRHGSSKLSLQCTVLVAVARAGWLRAPFARLHAPKSTRGTRRQRQMSRPRGHPPLRGNA